MSKRKTALALAESLGYQIVNLQGMTGYTDRKRPVWGIFDKRSCRVVASYSTWDDVLKFLQK
jgi:hypothetical protein